jgi:hypothetical protein
MFGRSGTSELQNLLGAGRAALKEVRTGSVPGSTVAVLEDGDEIENISPNTPPGSPDGIKQHSPAAKPAPDAPTFKDSSSKNVYDRICEEWEKLKDPETGFQYFCSKYVWISNQRHGYVHFKLYDYQMRTASLFSNNKFVVSKKFRQAGFSLLSGVYVLYYSLINPRMQSLIISTGMRASTKYLSENVRDIYESLPQWMKGGLDSNGRPIKWLKKKAYKDSATELWLPNKSKIRSIPSGKASGRGFSTKLLIVDEAAFIEGLEDLWTGIYPTLANTDGKCFLISTSNGVGGTGGFFYRIYKDAMEKANDFVVADVHYKEHPDYCDPEWESQMFRQLGQRKWDQEVLGKFLASGNTFIDAIHIEGMEKFAESCPKPKTELGGKLQVWRDFIPGHHYAIGADCATGGGLDNSCAQVVDVDTGEQVAEYKGKVAEDQFATVLATLGYRYGTAVIAVELNSTAGGAVIMSLQKIQKYKRLYAGEDGKIGWNTNVRTRNLLIADLESNLYNNAFKIYSLRLVDELKTFIVTKTGKIEHDINSHDDCIFSWMIATNEAVMRTARRATPKQPESVLMVEDSSQPEQIISKPIYSADVDAAEQRKKRESLLTGSKHSQFLERMSTINEAAGEDVLSWLLK